MLKKFSVYFFCFIIMMSASISTKASEKQGTLGEQLNHLLTSNHDLQGAIAGINIRNAKNGQIIYDHLGDVRLRPASNMKLLTAAAALNVLGEEYTFTTEVLADGPLKNNTVYGNLYLRGKGDPTLLKSDLDKMAEGLQKRGIKTIKGNLISDDIWYDDVRYSGDLMWSDEYAHYGAQISALTASPNHDYDAGSVIVEVKPGEKNGDKPEVKISPKTDYVEVINEAKTVPKEGTKKINIGREHAKNVITIKGTIPTGSKSVKEWIGVWEPTGYAMSLFEQSLAKYGITFSGKINMGTVPDNAKVLVEHHSMTLGELLVPFMKLSNNVHGEVLVKEMGKMVKGEGSWERGLEVLIKEIAKLGMDPETVVLRDGSGISHVDLIPAREITQLLFAVQKEKWFPTFLNSLPVSGETDRMVGGTLKKRMTSPELIGKVKAKTGTIDTVSSLSGYVVTKSGQTLIFSIVLNNLVDEEKGKGIEDKIVSILAGM